VAIWLIASIPMMPFSARFTLCAMKPVKS